MAAQDSSRDAEAAVDRAGTILRTTNAQVNAQLRPGADASRAEAELAAARTEVVQAQQAIEVARTTVSQFTGIDASEIALSAPRLLQLPPEENIVPPNTAANPIAAEQNAVVETAMAQLRALERSYFPRFFLQGTAYARGTGAKIDGRLLGGVNGLAPDAQNYAIGFSMTFPVLDLPSIRARENEQAATVRAETARSHQIAVDLRARWNQAVATLRGARQVALNTPAQVSAARAALDQASARYQSGLGNIDAVAEAQRLLAQAEIDDALARLEVWRGLLGIATAAGDLQPFLAEAGQ